MLFYNVFYMHNLLLKFLKLSNIRKTATLINGVYFVKWKAFGQKLKLKELLNLEDQFTIQRVSLKNFNLVDNKTHINFQDISYKDCKRQKSVYKKILIDLKQKLKIRKYLKFLAVNQKVAYNAQVVIKNHRSMNIIMIYHQYVQDLLTYQECQRSNSLREAFDEFFKVDVLSGNNKYKCQKCKRQSNANKRFIFSQFPEIFTVQLKRFTNNLRKITKYISYDNSINLAKYSQNNNQKIIYDLYGIVVHAGGSSFSGHYYSFIKCGTQWFKMDDSWVSKSNQNQVNNQSAYLLFYRKRKIVKLKQKQKIQIEQNIVNKSNSQKTNQKVKQKNIQKSIQKNIEKNQQKNNQKIIINGNLVKNNDQSTKNKLNNNQQNIQKNNSQTQKQKSNIKKNLTKLSTKNKQQQPKTTQMQQQIPQIIPLQKGASIAELYTNPPINQQLQINEQWLSRIVNVILNKNRYKKWRYPRRLRSLQRLRKYDKIVKKRKSK